MNKQALSERDICTKIINPAIQKAGWDIQTQVREEEEEPYDSSAGNHYAFTRGASYFQGGARND